MKYDFDRVTDRRGTGSAKWDISRDELPMWVADMDFQTAPEIISALNERAENGIFGYGVVPPEWGEALCAWWRQRHHTELEPDWLLFSTGVMPSVSAAIRRLTAVGEKVLLQTPVYSAFFGAILSNGRRVAENPLIYEDGEYRIDFEDLDRKLADPQTTLMLLCSPHNPIGKIWDRETLARVGELCLKHRVPLVSDEIHCDLTDPGFEFVPFSSLPERLTANSISCVAPTKTFNLAGLQTSAVIVPDPALRERISRQLKTDHAAEPGSFAIVAAVAAYTEGGPWLDALRDYLAGNKAVAREFIARELPEVGVSQARATYLLWLDCGAFTESSRELADFLRRETGLWLNPGDIYGISGGRFLRINIACPRGVLMDGLERLKRGLSAYRDQRA